MPAPINWNELVETADEAPSFDPLPANDYLVKITAAEAVSASTGKPMLKTTLEVEGGPYNGRRLWHNFVISQDNPKAMSIFFRQMNALGL